MKNFAVTGGPQPQLPAGVGPAPLSAAGLRPLWRLDKSNHSHYALDHVLTGFLFRSVTRRTMLERMHTMKHSSYSNKFPRLATISICNTIGLEHSTKWLLIVSDGSVKTLV